MEIDINKIDIEAKLMDLVFGVDVTKENDIQNIKLDISSDKVSGSANIDIKLGEKSE